MFVFIFLLLLLLCCLFSFWFSFLAEILSLAISMQPLRQPLLNNECVVFIDIEDFVFTHGFYCQPNKFFLEQLSIQH